MSDIDDLVAAADRLCASLEKASQNEKKFNDDICHEFQKMSRDTRKMSDDLKYIREELC